MSIRVVALLILVMGLSGFTGCSRPRPSAPPIEMPTTTNARPPLAVGESFPDWQSLQWINGTPPQREDKAVRGIVVDIWATWCPYCAKTAPGLVEVQQQYKDRGIAFVSLTDLNEKIASDFLREHKMSWPCAVGLNRQTIEAMGALQTAMRLPDLNIAPTLYVIDRQGKVLYSDNQARYRHQEPEVQLKALRAALDRILREKAKS